MPMRSIVPVSLFIAFTAGAALAVISPPPNPTRSGLAASGIEGLQLIAGSGGSSSSSKKGAKKPLQTRPVKKPPPGAREVTKGQTGRCICSTNAEGKTRCTGNCS